MTDTTVPAIKTLDERKHIIATAVNAEVARGWRVESQSDVNAVLVKGHRPNHLLHFILGFFTFGAWWLFIWLPLMIFGGEKRVAIAVDEYGNTRR